jgi:ParB family chromosome partitioning protein
MFVKEGYKLSEVESIQLEIRMGGFRDSGENVAKTSRVLVRVLGELAESLLPVTKVRLEDIQIVTDADRKYIFRAVSDDAEVSKAQEAEIQALAHSIDKDGLVHPLVLIQNGNGKYRILCGSRRFNALKLLKRKWLDARIYKEEDLTEEERIRISLAENARRKNLNPIEIGMFLQAARQNGKGKRTYKSLGKEFGEMLGIGTSHSSVQKYIKLDEVRVKGESQEMINDVLKGQLAFGTAAEVLAFIDDANDRNTLYSQIVKPMKPTKPELGDIKKWLEEARNGNGLKSALTKKDVKKAIKQANKSEQKSQELIKLLKLLAGDPLTKQKQGFEEAVKAFREKIYGAKAGREDFDIVPPPDMEKNEVIIQFRFTLESLKSATEKAQEVLKDQQLKQLLDTIESP